MRDRGPRVPFARREAGIEAVLFDFSGTLFQLDYEDSWFAGPDGIEEPERREALVRRLDSPMAESVELTPWQRDLWERRDLDFGAHRESFLHVAAASGVARGLAERLHAIVTDPDRWTPYPDTAVALRSLCDAGIRIGVVSNIAFDIRPAFRRIAPEVTVDVFALSFERGAIKPDPRIFRYAMEVVGVDPERTLMVGDSVAADGAARDIGGRFAPVRALPTAERPDGLLRVLAEHRLPTPPR